MGVFLSILVVSTILFTGATNMGANNKSQKRPRGANAVTSKESSAFLGFFAPKPPAGDAETDPQSIDLEAGLRVPLLGDELTKRESIVHNLSTAYTWLVYDASVMCHSDN
jgi:hypothetical protein